MRTSWISLLAFAGFMAAPFALAETGVSGQALQAQLPAGQRFVGRLSDADVVNVDATGVQALVETSWQADDELAARGEEGTPRLATNLGQQPGGSSQASGRRDNNSLDRGGNKGSGHGGNGGSGHGGNGGSGHGGNGGSGHGGSGHGGNGGPGNGGGGGGGPGNGGGSVTPDQGNVGAGIYRTDNYGVAIYYNGQGAFCSYPSLGALQSAVPEASWDYLQNRPLLDPSYYGFRYDGNCLNDPDLPSQPTPSDLYQIPNGMHGVISYRGGWYYCQFTSMEQLTHYWSGASVAGVVGLPLLDPKARGLTSSGICNY